MLKNYIKSLSLIADTIDENLLKRFISVIDKTIKKNNKIFICGNGGSASLSDHALCDWTKRLYPKKKCKIFDLTSNKSLISAIGNDISFDKIFSYQISIYAEKKDLCIFISSSGNSKNILNGIIEAKKKGIKTISILGFKGGKAKKLSDLAVHFPTTTYEHHEDLAQILMHYIYTKIK
jgi:D-sedoheptulose 7-phosphate isomerase